MVYHGYMKDNSAVKYFEQAAKVAEQSPCKKARCGTVIVKDGEVIGDGYNGPVPGDVLRCENRYDVSRKPKYDVTCCVHAEWRAIIDACKKAGNGIEGSTLYFMRIDDGGRFTDAGEPFCTVCSRLAYESGVAYFSLWNDDGAVVYDTKSYNQASYEYYE